MKVLACNLHICRRRRRLERYSLQVRHKQDWGREFILLLPQAAVLPGSDADSDVVKPASGFVIQNRQTLCSMWCPMYSHAVRTWSAVCSERHTRNSVKERDPIYAGVLCNDWFDLCFR